MTTQPRWEATDQADLLSLVADTEHPSVDFEWLLFKKALAEAADHAGVISPNALRPLVRGHIAPRRIGALTHKALAERLVAYTGNYVVSDDTEGRNGGKPARELRLITSSERGLPSRSAAVSPEERRGRPRTAD